MSAIPSDDLAGEQESMSSLPTLPQTKLIYVSPTMENAIQHTFFILAGDQNSALQTVIAYTQWNAMQPIMSWVIVWWEWLHTGIYRQTMWSV